MESLRKFYMATSTDGGGANPSDDASKANERLKDTIDIVAALKDAFTTLGQTIAREMTGNIQDANEEVQDLGKILASQIKNGMKSWGKDSAAIADNAEKISKGVLESKDVQEQLNKAARQYNKTLADVTIALNNNVISEAQALSYALKIEEAYSDQVNSLRLQQLEAVRVEKVMGNLGKIVKGMSKIPLVGELINAEKILKKMQQTAADGGSKLAVMGAGLKETFKTIGDSLTDFTTLIPLITTGFIKLVKLAAEYQSKQFETAKSLGVSVERGKQLRDSFVGIARSNLNLAIKADDLEKSYAGVQNELGIIVKQSAEFNVSSTLIERRTGATAEHMATLQFAAKKMGTSMMGAYQTIVGTSKAVGARLRLEMSEKQILDGISKVSATVYANFKGNYTALTQAVVQAKKLGLTLDQVQATQSQFLDFGSSIEKQFEAEVLTGEDLNMTRLRELALMHDTAGMQKELNRLLGTQSEFNKLDANAQISKAESLGLSVDAINKMYQDQERIKVLGDAAGADLQTQYEKLQGMKMTREQIVATMGQEAASSAQQASVSERLAATLDAIKNSIAQAATALLPIVEKVMKWLSNMENLKGVLKAIAGIIGGIVGYSVTMSILDKQRVATQIQLMRMQVVQNAELLKGLGIQTVLTETQIAGAAANVTAGSGWMGPGALAVGLAAAAALSALAGSAMGGVGGGGGETGMAMTAPSTGMSPMNTAAAQASSGTAQSVNNPAAAKDNQRGGNVYLDNYKVGYIQKQTLSEIYG